MARVAWIIRILHVQRFFNNGTTTIGDEVTLTFSKENGAGWVWDEAKKACVQNAPASVQTAHTSQLVRATGVKG